MKTKCSKGIKNGTQYLECGDLLFIDNSISYEKAKSECELYNSSLAYITIKNGAADDAGLEKFSTLALNELGTKVYMIGLKFEGEIGTWSNGENYDSKISGSLEKTTLAGTKPCNNVFIKSDLKTISRVHCGDHFFCAKKNKLVQT